MFLLASILIGCLPLVDSVSVTIPRQDAPQECRDLLQSHLEVTYHRYSSTGNVSERCVEQLSQELSYETAECSKRQRPVIYQAQLTLSTPPAKRLRKRRIRQKRRVYGDDERKCVSGRLAAKEYPFTTVVRLSTGCTGTLVSSRHVLTAAHCIHNRTAYVRGYNDLQVGRLKKSGSYHWTRVKSTFLPLGWTMGGNFVAPRYDYAVLVLKADHPRHWLPVAVSEGDRYGVDTRVVFTGFDDDKPEGHKCYRNCHVLEQDSDVLYFRCDAMHGSSGSGVYTMPSRDQRFLVGVFSGNRWKLTVEGLENFNAAVRMTSSKFKMLCVWLGCCQSGSAVKYYSKEKTCAKMKCLRYCPAPQPTTPPPETSRPTRGPAVNGTTHDGHKRL